MNDLPRGARSNSSKERRGDRHRRTPAVSEVSRTGRDPQPLLNGRLDVKLSDRIKRLATSDSPPSNFICSVTMTGPLTLDLCSTSVK